MKNPTQTPGWLRPRIALASLVLIGCLIVASTTRLGGETTDTPPSTPTPVAREDVVPVAPIPLLPSYPLPSVTSGFLGDAGTATPRATPSTRDQLEFVPPVPPPPSSCNPGDPQCLPPRLP